MNPIEWISRMLMAQKGVQQPAGYGRGAPPANATPTRPIPGLSSGTGSPVQQVIWDGTPPYEQPPTPGMRLDPQDALAQAMLSRYWPPGSTPQGLGPWSPPPVSGAGQEGPTSPIVNPLDTSGPFSRDFEGTPLGGEGSPLPDPEFDAALGMGSAGGEMLPFEPEALGGVVGGPGDMIIQNAGEAPWSYQAPPFENYGLHNPEDSMREQTEEDMLRRSRGMQEIILELLSRGRR